MRHHTKDKGDLAVTEIIAALARHSIQVCIPLSEHMPFDIIAVSPEMKLSRIQCKYRSMNKIGTIIVDFRNTYGCTKGIIRKHLDKTELDSFAIYCPDNNRSYFVPMQDVSSKQNCFSLRLTPAKNNQKALILLADNYLNPLVIF